MKTAVIYCKLLNARTAKTVASKRSIEFVA